MATCNNCGHTQSDFITAADIEGIQLQTILLQERLQKMEAESASLRAMLKTQSDQHQERIQELLSDFEAEVSAYRHNNGTTADAEQLRCENELLKSSIFELNLKLNTKDEAYQAVKAELHETLEESERIKKSVEYLQGILTVASLDHETQLKKKDDAIEAVKAELHESREEGERSKEMLKTNGDYLKAMELELVTALERADQIEEMTFARNNVVAEEDVAQKDLMLKMQLEKSFGTSLEKFFPKKYLQADSEIDAREFNEKKLDILANKLHKIASDNNDEDVSSGIMPTNRIHDADLFTSGGRISIQNTNVADTDDDVIFFAPRPRRRHPIAGPEDDVSFAWGNSKDGLSTSMEKKEKVSSNEIAADNNVAESDDDVMIFFDRFIPVRRHPIAGPEDDVSFAWANSKDGSSTIMQEKEEVPSNETAAAAVDHGDDAESDVEVIEMTDEILDLVF